MPEGQEKQPLLGRVVRVDAKVVHVDVPDPIASFAAAQAEAKGGDGEEAELPVVETVLAALRGTLFEDLDGKKNPISVGDLVRVDRTDESVSVEEVLPRRNYLGRVASSHDPREQVLVANVDQLFMVGSLKNPGFSSNRTDRILAACRWHEIPATLIFNKADLDKKGALMDKYRKTYAGIPDLGILVTSTVDGRGIEDLTAQLKGKVSVLYGPSGAGKSSLLNAIQPGLNIKEGKISSYWKQGKHTTTYSRLHRMDLGGYVVDTPGIRVFRPHGLTRSHVRDLFPDFAKFQALCEFANCTHDHEPGCAVSDASEAGMIPDTRYASYLSLLDEVDPDAAYDPDEEGDLGLV